MKLNENGDFCLLYVEPEDEKLSLFETISAQTKPVVLMLPLAAGQPRSRLFQRPEDFSDLKHVRRQSGVSVTFLTSGSEFLALMAARYGFPAYSSIDVFAEALAHGQRSEREESETRGNLYAQRRARTGPLTPSAQVAMIRRSMPTGPLNMRAGGSSWPVQEKSTPRAEYPAPASGVSATPLNAPADIAFLPPPERGPRPGERETPLPRTRVSGPLAASLPGNEFPKAVENGSLHPSEIPRRRSARQTMEEPHTHHPGWEPEDHMFDLAGHSTVDRPQAPKGSAPRSLADMPTHVPQAPPAARTRADTSMHVPQTPLAPRSTPVAPVHPPEPKVAGQRRGLSPVLIILSLLILAGAGLGSFVAISRSTPPTPPVVAKQVGSINFLSSEQLNQNTSQGIDDQVQITLHNLSSPAPGKSYYAWLLGDKDQSESQSILLGKLNVVNGSVSLFYPGDASHTNLLQITSRFLITEEDSNVTPLMPSPDTSTWRYYGEIPSIPDPNDPHHYAFLNHLRHLLADEPILDELELPGGLNNWFTRNTEELLEWTSSARDQWQNTRNLTFVRDEGIQILSYLDGMSFVVQDLPPASANIQVTLDTHLAALGLLNVRGPNQEPPSYMDQIVYHLNGLINAPGATASVRATAADILPALSNVNTWLQTLRSDDKKLLAMTNAQMGQPAALSLLDDMVLQASNAYTGTTDPSTGQSQPGVVWLHQKLQSMAIITVSTYVSGSAVPEIGPSSQNASSFLLRLSAVWQDLKEWL
jgi:hypothetical protein